MSDSSRWANIPHSLIRDDEPNVIDAITQLPPELAVKDPFAVAWYFLQMLDDPAEFREQIESLTTPESLPAWGDYSAAHALRAELGENVGLASNPKPAAGAPDVRYAALFADFGADHIRSNDDQVVIADVFFTLVWRPEYDQWMVHAFGPRIAPEDVPRSA